MQYELYVSPDGTRVVAIPPAIACLIYSDWRPLPREIETERRSDAEGEEVMHDERLQRLKHLAKERQRSSIRRSDGQGGKRMPLRPIDLLSLIDRLEAAERERDEAQLKVAEYDYSSDSSGMRVEQLEEMIRDALVIYRSPKAAIRWQDTVHRMANALTERAPEESVHD